MTSEFIPSMEAERAMRNAERRARRPLFIEDPNDASITTQLKTDDMGLAVFLCAINWHCRDLELDAEKEGRTLFIFTWPADVDPDDTVERYYAQTVENSPQPIAIEIHRRLLRDRVNSFKRNQGVLS